MFLKNPDGSIYIGSIMNQEDFYSLCCTGTGSSVSKCCTAWRLYYDVAGSKWDDPIRLTMGPQDCYIVSTRDGTRGLWDDVFELDSNQKPIVAKCALQDAVCSDKLCDFWLGSRSCLVSEDPLVFPPVLGPPSATAPDVFNKIYYISTSSGRRGVVSACGCPPCVVISGRITVFRCPGGTQVGTFEFTTVVSLTGGPNAVCTGTATVSSGDLGSFTVKIERRITPSYYGGFHTQWYIQIRGGQHFMEGESTIYLLTGAQMPLTGCYQLGQNTSCAAAQAAGKTTYATVSNLRVSENGGGCPSPPQGVQGTAASQAILTVSPDFIAGETDVTKTESQQLFLDADQFNALPSDQRAEVAKLAFSDGGIQTTASGVVVENSQAVETPAPSIMRIPDNAIETCHNCADPSCPNISICCGGQVNVQIRVPCMKNLWGVTSTPAEKCDEAALQQTMDPIKKAQTPGDATQRAEVQNLSSVAGLEREQTRFAICTSKDAEGNLCPGIVGTAGAYCKQLWPTGPSCRCTWRKFLLQADTKCPIGRW